MLIFVVVAFGVSVLPYALPSGVVVFIGMVAICLTVMSCRGSLVSVYLAVFFAALFWSSHFARQVSDNWLAKELQQTTLTIEAEVTGVPVISDETTRFDVVLVSSDVLPNKIRLSWFRAPELIPGERWQFTVKLKRPHTFASPGTMDYEAWIVRQGIQATGYVKAGESLKPASKTRQWLNRWRLQLKQWVNRHTSESTQGMLVALLTGDKSGISQSQWQSLNLTGTTHLMVISGLHIGLMAALGFWLVRCLGKLLPLPLRKVPMSIIAGCSGLLLALFYAALAGFSIPVQRALIMTVVALLGPVLGVRPAGSTLWLTALMLVVFCDPLAFTSPGFWYSFLAVAALLFGMGGRRQLLSGFMKITKPQWVVFCVLTPLLLMSGQSVSLFAPLINLLAIPLVALLVVPLVLMAGFLSVIWPWLAVKCLMLAETGILVFNTGLIWFESWSMLLPVPAAPDMITLLLALFGGFLLISPTSLRLKWFAPVLLLPWLFPRSSAPDHGEAECVVFDIGQGLSVLIRTQQHTLIYDTGDRFTNTLSAADRVLLPGLRMLGVRHIDRVMISHGDRDHSGGLPTLLKQFGGVDVWAGSPIEGYQGDYKSCQAGQHWRWDGVDFQILAGSEFKLSNDRSCVLKVTAGKDSFLLPGDISRKVEKSLLSRNIHLRANILLAPHHGSKYSSSKAFLEAVQPEEVIFSSGFGNRFGHPASETCERVSDVNARSWNTATDGSVSFTLGADRLQLSGYRQTHARYWWN